MEVLGPFGSFGADVERFSFYFDHGGVSPLGSKVTELHVRQVVWRREKVPEGSASAASI